MAKKVVDRDLEEEKAANPQFVEEFCTKPAYDEDGVQASAGIMADGKEYGDPTPMAPPVGFEAPPDLQEMMRQMIRNENYQRMLDEAGWDTEEEAADFDLDDEDPMPVSVHQLMMQSPPSPPVAEPTAPLPAAPATASAAKEGGAGGPSQTQAPPAPSDATASTST